MTEFEYYWEKAEFQDPVSHRTHVENYKKGIRDSIAFDEQYQKEAEEELKRRMKKMIANIIFCLCLFLAIWYTVISIFRACYKQNLDYQLIVLSAAWTGVITHLMHIW